PGQRSVLAGGVPAGDPAPRDRAHVRRAALVAAAEVAQRRRVADRVEPGDRMAAEVHHLRRDVRLEAVRVDADADRHETYTEVRRLVGGADAGVGIARIAGEPLRPRARALVEVGILALARELVEARERALEPVGVDAELLRELARRRRRRGERLGDLR